MIENALAIKGWMSPEELEWLASQARISDIIYEFGCFHGRSTRALADNTPGIIFAVDPWDGVYYKDNSHVLEGFDTNCYNEFINNLKDHIDTGKVIPIRDYSWSVKGPKANLVFIDGDHRFENVIDDIKCAMCLINPGGIIAGHDYTHSDWPGVKRAVDFMFPSIEQCDSIWSVRV